MNSVNITGRLAASPELRTTGSGLSVCSFTLAVPRPRNHEQVDWIPCTAWRQSAEYLCKYGAKGMRVEVSGYLNSRQYTDRDDNRRTAYEVVSDSLSLLERRENAGEVSTTDPNPFAAQTGAEGVERDIAAAAAIGDDDLPF